MTGTRRVAPPLLFLLAVAIWPVLLVPAQARAAPRCGGNLAADFNGDGVSDLAVGIPGESVGGLSSAGAVQLIYGSESGLSAFGNQFLTTADAGIVVEAQNMWGEALATGDFDGDGFSDLAASMPDDDVDAIVDAGSVIVLYGSNGGLLTSGALVQGRSGIADVAEEGDAYGHSLAPGDFDGDGYCDLAVGAALEDVGTKSDAGAVNVVFGSENGLDGSRDVLWHQDSAEINDSAEQNDRFGAALASGNFGRGSRADLAIGVYGETDGVVVGTGGVSVLYGSSTGLTATDDQFWHQDASGVNDFSEQGDLFGFALAAADLGDSPHADLAISALGENHDAGAVNVLYGSSTGLTSTGDQFWDQDSPGVNGFAQDDERFGWALAAADLGGASQADLAIGVPAQEVDGMGAAGAVNVLYGSSTGLTSAGDQYWHQNSTGINGVAEVLDQFGDALTALNLGESSHADLGVGVFRQDVASIVDAGAVNVLYGSTTGLTPTGDQLWHQDRLGILDTAEADDEFGSALGRPM